MSRNKRRVALLACLETVSGDGTTPDASTNAILFEVDNFNATIGQQFDTRDMALGYLGGPDKIATVRRGTVSFSVELAGSGTAGTAAPWGVLQVGCGYASAVSAGSRVTYNPASTGLKTLSLFGFVDGVKKKFNFCTGDFTATLVGAARPRIDYTFQCLVTDITESALPSAVFTPWKRPLPVTPGNTSGLLWGCTFTTGLVAIGSGAEYEFTSLIVKGGNSIQDINYSKSAMLEIDNRAPTLEATVKLTAAQEVLLTDLMATGNTTAIGVNHGQVAGSRSVIYAPAARLTAMADDYTGNIMHTKLMMDLMPVAGNDELILVDR